MSVELLEGGILTTYFLYVGVLATAVATFTYVFHTQWLVLLVARYFPYLLSGLENKTVEVNEMTISYLDRNPSPEDDDQETVLILHGYTACKEAMASLVMSLPRRWRLIIPDLPAHGETLHLPGANYTQEVFVDTIHKFTKAVGLKKFHLVGESMGALLSLVFATKYEDMLKTMTVLCPPLEDAKRSKYFRTLEDTGRNIILAENVTEFNRMLELVHHKPPKRMPQRVVKAFVEIQNNRRKGYEDVFLQLMLSRESPEVFYEKLRSINVPVSIVWGEDDRVCDISGGHILTKVITHAEMTVVKRCGHALSLERPKKTSYLIRGFIQKHLKIG